MALRMNPMTGQPEFIEDTPVINETTGQQANTAGQTATAVTTLQPATGRTGALDSSKAQQLSQQLASGAITTQEDVDRFFGRTPATKAYLGADNFYYIEGDNGQALRVDAKDLPENVDIIPLYQEGSDIDAALAKYGLTRQPGGDVTDTTSLSGGTIEPEEVGLTFADLEAQGGEGATITTGGQTYTVTPDGKLKLTTEDIQDQGITGGEKLPDGATTNGGGGAFDQGAALSPDEIEQYFATQSGAANPLSPTEFAQRLRAGASPNDIVDAQNVAIEKTDRALSDAGASTTRPSDTDSPFSFMEDILEQILVASGYNELKETSQALLDEIEEDNEMFSDQVETINLNPWLSEGQRNRQISKAQEKHQLRVAGKQLQYEALVAEAESQRDNARWLASTAMNVHFQQQQIDLAKEKFAWDRAEAKAAAAESSRRFGITQAADLRDFNEAVRQFNLNYGLDLLDAQGGLGGDSITEAFDNLVGPEGATAEGINQFIAAVSAQGDISGASKSELLNAFQVINSVADFAASNPEGGFAGLGLGAGFSNFLGLGTAGNIIMGTGQEATDNRASIEGINLKLQQWASGAALTDAQTKQVEEMTVRKNDSDWEVVYKTNALYNYMLDQVEGVLITEGYNVTFPKIDLFEVGDLMGKASPSDLERLNSETTSTSTLGNNISGL